jgi:hypothetical protein
MGNGRKPTSAPPHPGCWTVAPLLPQCVHRARSLSTSLDALAPQRMTATAHASGAWCWQRSQFGQSHGVARRRSPSVVAARGVFMKRIERPAGAPGPAATRSSRSTNADKHGSVFAAEKPVTACCGRAADIDSSPYRYIADVRR